MKPRLGIYIHIPFCAGKCSYCDFYSLAGCDELMPEYQKALLEHIAESAPGIKNYEVDSIYFGGAAAGGRQPSVDRRAGHEQRPAQADRPPAQLPAGRARLFRRPEGRL